MIKFIKKHIVFTVFIIAFLGCESKDKNNTDDSCPRTKPSVKIPPIGKFPQNKKDKDFLATYNWNIVAKNLEVGPANIQPFSTTDPEEISKRQLELLNSEPLKTLNIKNELDDLYKNFGQKLQFKDYSKEIDNNNIDQSTALYNIRKFAPEFFYPNNRKEIDLQFALKRSLWEIKNMADQEKKQKAAEFLLLALGSGGQHCVDAQTDAVKSVEAYLFKDNGLGLKEPKTFKENFLNKLDQLREYIFKQSISFSDNNETGVTEQLLRYLLSNELGIKSSERPLYDTFYYRSLHSLAHEFKNLMETMPYYKTLQLSRDLLEDLVRMRFFAGKIGAKKGETRPDGQSSWCDYLDGYTPGCDGQPILLSQEEINRAQERTEELRRSHIGYNAQTLAEELALFLRDNPVLGGNWLNFIANNFPKKPGDTVDDMKEIIKQEITDDKEFGKYYLDILGLEESNFDDKEYKKLVLDNLDASLNAYLVFKKFITIVDNKPRWTEKGLRYLLVGMGLASGDPKI
jgi:hypothetical protein